MKPCYIAYSLTVDNIMAASLGFAAFALSDVLNEGPPWLVFIPEP